MQECYLPLHTDLSEEQKALFDFCIVDRTVFFFSLLLFNDPRLADWKGVFDS